MPSGPQYGASRLIDECIELEISKDVKTSVIMAKYLVSYAKVQEIRTRMGLSSRKRAS